MSQAVTFEFLKTFRELVQWHHGYWSDGEWLQSKIGCFKVDEEDKEELENIFLYLLAVCRSKNLEPPAFMSEPLTEKEFIAQALSFLKERQSLLPECETTIAALAAFHGANLDEETRVRIGRHLDECLLCKEASHGAIDEHFLTAEGLWRPLDPNFEETTQQIVDLFAQITCSRPPNDPEAVNDISPETQGRILTEHERFCRDRLTVLSSIYSRVLEVPNEEVLCRCVSGIPKTGDSSDPAWNRAQGFWEHGRSMIEHDSSVVELWVQIALPEEKSSLVIGRMVSEVREHFRV